MGTKRDPLLASLNASLNSPGFLATLDKMLGSKSKPNRKPTEKKPAAIKPAIGQTSFI